MRYLNWIFIVAFILSTAGIAVAQTDQWKVYNTTNSNLPENYILSLAIDENDNKWVGTTWGLMRFDGSNWITYHKKSTKDIQFTTVRTITVDSNSNVWTGTWGDGMAELTFTGKNPSHPNAPYKWLYYRKKNSAVTHNTVKCIAIDNNGSKWIGTEDGLVSMQSMDWGDGGIKWKTYFKYNSGLPNDAVYTIAVDKFNNKWIGTFGGGLAKFDGTNWTVYDIRNSGLPDNYIISLIVDNNQILWIGTYSGGLARFDGVNWKVFKTSNSKIPENVVYSMAVDKNNNLWIGSISNGLAKYDGKFWTSYDIMNSGQPYTVSSIAIDKRGNKWIGTGGGVAVFNEFGIR